MKIEPKKAYYLVETIIDLIDKLKKHKGIKSLNLKWYIVPHPEDDDYLLFVAKKKLKEYPDCNHIGGTLIYDLVKKNMDREIDNLFLSLEDMIQQDKISRYKSSNI